LSGGSGRGKSTLLAELERRGYATVEEPGRRIVKEELERSGTALPWVDPVAFARRAIDVALHDRRTAPTHPSWVFFDRGLVDAASALEDVTGVSAEELCRSHRYNPTVFLAPPWPEIYVADPERQLGFEFALAEFRRLELAYPKLGYGVIMLPKASVAERADFMLAELVASST
jgi:predicted ATPase